MTEREHRLRQLIREYRGAAGVTQANLAEFIGVSRRTYHRIESGHGRITRLAEICKAIGCDPEALLREAGFSSVKGLP